MVYGLLIEALDATGDLETRHTNKESVPT